LNTSAPPRHLKIPPPRRSQNIKTNASARLTTWYSIGQIAGPALVAVALSENIVAAFIASAIALAIAMVLTLIGTLTGGVER